MLSAEHRLRRREDFSAVVRAGRRAGSGVLVVHLTTTAGADDGAGRVVVSGPEPSRVGFVIPKTVGNAVVRNKLRRRLRHLMRDRLSALPAGTDVVIRALPGAGAPAYSRIEKDLDGALVAARTRPRSSARRRPSGASGTAEP